MNYKVAISQKIQSKYLNEKALATTTTTTTTTTTNKHNKKKKLT